MPRPLHALVGAVAVLAALLTACAEDTEPVVAGEDSATTTAPTDTPTADTAPTTDAPAADTVPVASGSGPVCLAGTVALERSEAFDLPTGDGTLEVGGAVTVTFTDGAWTLTGAGAATGEGDDVVAALTVDGTAEGTYGPGDAVGEVAFVTTAASGTTRVRLGSLDRELPIQEVTDTLLPAGADVEVTCTGEEVQVHSPVGTVVFSRA